MTDHARSARINRWSHVIFYLGWYWSMFAFAVVPTRMNFFILLLYCLALFYRVWRRASRSWGTITRSNGDPLKGVIVTLTNKEIPHLKYPPVVTKSDGRYNFLVDRGKYSVIVSAFDGTNQQRSLARPQSVEIKSNVGVIAEDISGVEY